MTLAEKKTHAKSAYQSAKARYLETLSKKDWAAFCEAKKVCMLLGVII